MYLLVIVLTQISHCQSLLTQMQVAQQFQNNSNATAVVDPKFILQYYVDKKTFRTQETSYKAIKQLFAELANSCTVYFYGKYRDRITDTFYLLHLYDICANNTRYWNGNCVQLITSLHAYHYLWEWTDFNFYHTRNKLSKLDLWLETVNESKSHQYHPSREIKPIGTYWTEDDPDPYYSIFSRLKHHSQCLVLVRTEMASRQHRYITRGFEGASKISDYASLPYNGRISPAFIIIFIKEPKSLRRCNNNDSKNLCDMTEWSNIMTSGTSIVLFVLQEPKESPLLLHHFLGIFSPVAIKDCTVAKINTLWNELHRETSLFNNFRHSWRLNVSLIFFRHDSNLTEDEKQWRRLNKRICSGTPRVQDYLYSKSYLSAHRIWDPQEDCVYETILSKYLKNAPGLNAFMWPFTMEFDAVRTSERDNDYVFGKRGKYFIPATGRFQGFRYSLFIDRKSIKTEFDMTSLLKPFQTEVWILFIAAVAALALFMKLASNSLWLFWITAVLLEHEVKIRLSFPVCIVAIFWQLSAIQLRLYYTGNMISAITTEILPPMPEKMRLLFDDANSRQFDMFTRDTEFEELVFGSWRDNEDKIGYEKLLYFVKPINKSKLWDLVKQEKESKSLILGKAKSKRRPYHRIALISYTHPFKLQTCQPPRWPGEKQNRQWQAPFPLDTALLVFKERLLIKNTDDAIRRKLWVYQGKRNFFTKYFVRDINALVVSGIYGRWEAITCKVTEAMLLKNETSVIGFKHEWNFFSAACIDNSAKLKPPLSFRPVSNTSFMVIWALFVACIAISTLGYLKEIVRFHIPGRACPSCKYTTVSKYKNE